MILGIILVVILTCIILFFITNSYKENIKPKTIQDHYREYPIYVLTCDDKDFQKFLEDNNFDPSFFKRVVNRRMVKYSSPRIFTCVNTHKYKEKEILIFQSLTKHGYIELFAYELKRFNFLNKKGNI